MPSRDVALDTNVFLLLLAGFVDPDLIARRGTPVITSDIRLYEQVAGLSPESLNFASYVFNT